MNQLEIFEHPQFGEIRVLTIDNEPWWVLADVCRVLDLKEPHRVAKRLDVDERTLSTVIDNMGRSQQTTVINESGLYSVILRSDKQEAKTFKRWVTHEVLPSIRKNGEYIAGRERFTMTREELQAAALAAVRKVMEEQQARSSADAAPPEESRFLKYFNSFMRWRENHSPTDKIVALYIGFLDAFNRRGWEEWTGIDTSLLMLLANTTSKATAFRARDALARAGLIEYQPGIKGKPSSYRLLVYDAPALRCGSVK